LSAEELLPLNALTGLDTAVIKAFLQLAPKARVALVNDYEARHGQAAAAWLARASVLWGRQRLGVSRVIIARLFALLPEYMEQAERLQLAESVWHVARAPTSATLRVPAGYRNHPVLRELVHEHFMTVLPSIVELPEVMRDSVPWLNDPALRAQHQVLNLLLLAERDQLLGVVDEQIEVLFARRIEGLGIRSNFSIGGHELLLRTDPLLETPQLVSHALQDIKTGRRFNEQAPKSALYGALIGLAFAVILAVLISAL